MQPCKPTWQPTASLQHLCMRAEILAKLRQFFADRHVLEVETPLLSQATVTDPHLHSFHTHYFVTTQQTRTYYLQTSPEFAMKRLLAAGSDSIYQICKAFRNMGEAGQFHNPEFTILEWYRTGFNHHQLMDEMDDLLQIILKSAPAQRLSYAELFQHYLQIDPHQASIQQLKQVCKELQLDVNHLCDMHKDDWLTLLLTHAIEPKLPKSSLFIYDFPASQAALARLRPGNPTVAERFEVYVNGIELANGFHELNSADEQRQRFLNDLQQRKKTGSPLVPLDENLIAALQHGLPDCAGVALGIDRLIMLATQQHTIQDIITFPIDRA